MHPQSTNSTPAYKAHCVDCGAGLRDAKSTRCRACYMKQHTAKDSRPRCVDCGVVVMWERTRCRACYHENRRKLLAEEASYCEGCGARLKVRTSKLCMTCIHQRAEAEQAAKMCPDCGVHISPYATRCRSCYLVYQREEAQKRVCTVPGCTRKAKAVGLCADHYRVRLIARKRSWGAKRKIALLPCCVCGYSRLRSRVHRINPPLGYVIGNMAPVCSRCHDEIHDGLIPQPLAVTSEQLAAL